MYLPTSVNDISFGIEIETIIPSTTSSFRVCDYHSRIHIGSRPLKPTLMPLSSWRAERDSSIESPNEDYKPCEFISPILYGNDGLLNVKEVVNCIKNTIKAEVNDSCGIHVHVGFPYDDKALKRLIHLVAAHEKALYSVTGTTKREKTRFARPIKSRMSPRVSFDFDDFGRIICSDPEGYVKYNIVNVSTLLQGHRGNTVEFRLFPSVLNPNQIIAWIRLCVGIVEKAIISKRHCPWDPKDKMLQRTNNPEEINHFNYLMLALGWSTGRSFSSINGKKTPKVWGEIIGENTPPISNSKANLLELSRNYVLESKKEKAQRRKVRSDGMPNLREVLSNGCPVEPEPEPDSWGTDIRYGDDDDDQYDNLSETEAIMSFTISPQE